MTTDTNIPWTHVPGFRGVTWNPTNGCSETGRECENCYAKHVTHRFRNSPRFRGLTLVNDTGVVWSGELRLNEDRLAEPATWREPRVVFVDSMSDLFHDKVPDEFILRVWDAMTQNPKHIFQVLTKRAGRMRDFVNKYVDAGRIPCAPNVWLGVSVGVQKSDWRIQALAETPAAVRFVSAEPLLEPLTLSRIMPDGLPAWTCRKCRGKGGWAGHTVVRGIEVEQDADCGWCDGSGVALDWVIAGGESGPGSGSFDFDWARDLRDEARARGVRFYMKQSGTLVATATNARAPDGRKDYKGENPENWPEDLRVREFPVMR